MGVLDWFLSNAEAVFTGGASRGFKRVDPLLLGVSLAASWIGFALAGYPSILLWTPYLLLLSYLAGYYRSVAVLRTLSIPMAFIAFMAGVFNPYKPLSLEWRIYLLSVVLRAFMYSSSGLLVLGGLGPHGSQALAARLGATIHDVTVLFYRQTPQLLRDMEVALVAQGLLGWKPHEALAGTLLEALRRNEEVKASLYLRGASPRSPRTPLALPGGGSARARVFLGAVALLLGVCPLCCLWFRGFL